MDSHSFWKNIMYNENVLNYTSYVYDEEYDILIEDDIVVYDDTHEWYNNIYESEADA